MKNNFDDQLLNVFRTQDQEYRWTELRNILLCADDLSRKSRDKEKAFGVKLTRSLKRLCRDYLDKNVKGHKNITYSLKEKARKEFILQSNFATVNVMAGIYKPGISVKEFRKKALDKYIQLFEELYWPRLLRAYQEAEEKSK